VQGQRVWSTPREQRPQMVAGVPGQLPSFGTLLLVVDLALVIMRACHGITLSANHTACSHARLRACFGAATVRERLAILSRDERLVNGSLQRWGWLRSPDVIGQLQVVRVLGTGWWE
jgi:hypothetical protein